MFLQYLKKDVIHEVDFFHADKHQSFLQIDFNTLGIEVSYKTMLPLLINMIKLPSTQRNKFSISVEYFKKEVRNGVHFLNADKIKVSASWHYHF